MLLQIILNQPQALATIVRQTPTWVWALLAGLLVLGLTQVRDRTASLARIVSLPLGMTAFSLWGTVSALGSSPHFVALTGVFAATAAALFAAIAIGRPNGTYDAATRSFALPGTLVPLVLILAIFLTKYVVGVELAMQPGLVNDRTFTLTVAALYGGFSGIFAGRTARLLKLVLRPAAHPALQA